MAQPEKHIHAWKLFCRKNMGSSAEWKEKVPHLTLLKTFRKAAHIEEWVKENGDKEMVYLAEHWVDGKRKNGGGVEHLCCGLFEKKDFSFTDKWAWDKSRGWHRTGYMHKTEGTREIIVKALMKNENS